MRLNHQQGDRQIDRQLQQTPIAIIGMAAIFPKARNLEEYWQNIMGKVDCISDVPPSRWNIEDYYDSDPRAPDKTYCKRGGFIPQIDFNPMEFGIPPNLLEVTDVSQLLSLVVAKQAMEDAGYPQERNFDRERVGVILGVAVGRQLGVPLGSRLQYPIWEKVLKSSGISEEDTQKIIDKIKSAYVNWEENAFPGMLANVVAGRIANRLDLGGTNCTIDAACASSLAAFKMAVSELTEHRADMMITGGVDTDNSAVAYLCFSKTPALSLKQQTRPFDIDSDGMMLGEGLGMMVLKRLADAEKDGDRIYAVIKGIGTSSDGRYKSIYAPRPEGQVRALRRAYEEAGLSPDSVQLLEAHGTGTLAGDPAEFAAVKEVFGENNPREQHIALGSVKSQIGHTKAAAGAASLIKTALALHQKVLPPTINISQPNPKLKIDETPFYLNTEARPWIRDRDGAPRRAGVSSFGFGGTNFHVVLEEYLSQSQEIGRIHRTPQTVLLFAETPEALKNKCEVLLQQLQAETAAKVYGELVEACQVLAIPLNESRVGFVAESIADAIKKLETTVKLLETPSGETWEHPSGIYYRQSGLNLAGKVVALFSGQGSQYLEMGRELTLNFPQMHHAYEELDSLLRKDGLRPVSEVVFPIPAFDEEQKTLQRKELQRTEYAQPAIGAFSLGLYRILHQAGFKPDFAAGHSFGELTALWAAGVLGDRDYCLLVKARGQAMAIPPNLAGSVGTMMAVTGEIGQLEVILQDFPKVTIANFNSPKQVVLAGDKPDIAKLQPILEKQGLSVAVLPVSAAFHTERVAYAQKPFALAIDAVHFQPPKIPVYTNITAQPYSSDPKSIQSLLKEHLLDRVRFKEQIESIYGHGGYCFVEFGPRRTLTTFVKDILGDRPHLAIALNATSTKSSDRQLREAVVQLQVAGLPLKNLDPDRVRPKIPETPNKKGLTYTLDGANYVSEKTKMAFEKALEDGQKVQIAPKEAIASPPDTTAAPVETMVSQQDKHLQPTEALISKNGHNPHPEFTQVREDEINFSSPREEAACNSVIQSHSVVDRTEPANAPVELMRTQPMPESSIDYPRMLESLEYSLAQFNQHQKETLQVHGQYLNHQMEYAKIFYHLMQQQNSLLANVNAADRDPATKSAILQSLERSMNQFQEHQAETLRVHERSLTYQAEYAKHFIQLTQQQYGLMIEGTSSRDRETATVDITYTPETRSESAAVAPVAHPTEPAVERQMTQNGQKTDADIQKSAIEVKPGIESSNETQAEERAPASTAPMASVEVKTAIEDKPVPETIPPKPQDMGVASSATSIDVRGISRTLLTIVSDKTGYPPEMLELDMDMEADLGIDSIKRVEILGAMQEQFPDAPQVNPEEIGELRTLGQIIERIEAFSAGISQVRPLAIAPTVEAPLLEIETVLVSEAQIVTDNNKQAEPLAESALVNSVDIAAVSETLLAIVSEKTGYPPEMLELDMDMEADLGIDSIKRVEILGAMAEQFPDAPPINPEELAELRTLGQIIDYMKQQSAEKKSLSMTASLDNSPT